MATVIEEDEEDQEILEKPSSDHKDRYLPCENVKITFLPMNSLPDMATKA